MRVKFIENLTASIYSRGLFMKAAKFVNLCRSKVQTIC